MQCTFSCPTATYNLIKTILSALSSALYYNKKSYSLL